MIPWAKPIYRGHEKEYLTDALDSTWISGGAYVERFEREFSTMHDAPVGVSTSNGTTALYLALLALGIGRGDEVIVPGFAFMAGANMVLATGARPVFADVDPATWCLDPTAVKRAITPRTQAVIAVHTYGNACDLDNLLDTDIPLIEDVAEALGTRSRTRLLGTIGEIGCFSFQATKTLTMGEGGLVLAAGAENLLTHMRLIRNHGMRPERRYWHEVVGHNFRLTNLQAAIGCAQLERIDEVFAQRRRVHAHYTARLATVPGLHLQRIADDTDPVVWAVAAELDPDAFRGDRHWVSCHLLAGGIECREGFCDATSMTHIYGEVPELPISRRLADNILSPPSHPALTESEIDQICDALLKLRR